MKFDPKIQRGTISGVYVSIHSTHDYKEPDYVFTRPVDQLELTPAGIVGDRHYGHEAVAGGRDKKLYASGTVIRNYRQWSAVAAVDIQQIDRNLSLESRLTAADLGANFQIDGLGSLSSIPAGAYVVVSPFATDFQPKRSEDVVLQVYAQMAPCRIAGAGLAQRFGRSDLAAQFPATAMEQGLNYRGIRGTVEKGGVIRPGYTLWLLTPTGVD
ncbi:TPA: hypothetical protein HA241_05230 [Candidatus Woesearchaeota archaeon]|nr:hypothetical protein [Candidatus Woesearchaeota archaeon]